MRHGPQYGIQISELSGNITCTDSPDGVFLQYRAIATTLLTIPRQSHLFDQMGFDIWIRGKVVRNQHDFKARMHDKTKRPSTWRNLVTVAFERVSVYYSLLLVAIWGELVDFCGIYWPSSSDGGWCSEPVQVTCFPYFQCTPHEQRHSIELCQKRSEGKRWLRSIGKDTYHVIFVAFIIIFILF